MDKQVKSNRRGRKSQGLAAPSPTLEAKLFRVIRAYTELSTPERRRFINAVAVSDQGPQNPQLGNRQPQRNAPPAPTSGMTGTEKNVWDYFRTAEIGQYKTEPDKTITPGRVTLAVRMRTNPIKGLTFDKLVNYLDQWQLGFFRLAGMAWDKMEKRDYQIQVVRPKRLKSVARHGYDILIREDIDESQEALAQQQKDFLADFYANAVATTALNPDEEGGMSLLVRQMMDAVGKYYAIHEIVWKPNYDGAGGLTARFIQVPVWWVEGTRGKLRFLQSEFQVYGVDMLPGEWVITCGDGIMEACSVVYLMKSLLLTSNLAFLDRFGMPGIHGETDAQKGTAEWNNFVESVEEFGQEWATVTNRGAKINLIEAKSNGDAGYEKLLEVFDRAITMLWRGSDLGTKSSQHGAGASLQEDESEILETDDSKTIEETLDTKVTKYALAWKFGPNTPCLAYVKLRTTPRRNIQDDLAVDDFLSGFKDSEGRSLLGVQATLERYSRPLPKPGEDRLEPGTAPQPNDPNKPGEQEPPDKTDKNPEFTFANAEEAEALKAAIQADLEEMLKELGVENDPAAAQAVFKTLLQSLLARFANGGAGSGDFGHGGRPGAVGGSASGVASVKEVLAGKKDEAAYAKVSPLVAAKIKSATGRDVSGYHHFVDRDALTHINSRHGVGKEREAGHEAVTKDDIEKIPEIVGNPDSVRSGGKSARGLETIVYFKRFNGTTYYVEEQWTKEKLLAAKTMWKKKT